MIHFHFLVGSDKKQNTFVRRSAIKFLTPDKYSRAPETITSMIVSDFIEKITNIGESLVGSCKTKKYGAKKGAGTQSIYRVCS